MAKNVCIYAWASTLVLLALVGCGKSDEGSDWYDDLLELKGWSVVDRIGMPGTNTIFIDAAADKDAFNVMDDTDAAINQFRSKIKTKADTLRTEVIAYFGGEDTDANAITTEALAILLVPDVLVLDFAKDSAFPNGRELSDDVFDKMLGLSLNRGNVLGGGSGISDEVESDDKITGTLPFLAEPKKK